MMTLMGTGGEDPSALHSQRHLPKVGLTSMEKVTAMTSVSTRASIRQQLVGLLKSQVRIESMYGTKKEKLYLSASAIYNFIARLLHSACQIALSPACFASSRSSPACPPVTRKTSSTSPSSK